VSDRRHAGRDRWPSWVGTILAPVLVLVLAVALVATLVLTGVVQGEVVRPQGEARPTTEVTIVIEP
jgi:hypothetical protein